MLSFQSLLLLQEKLELAFALLLELEETRQLLGLLLLLVAASLALGFFFDEAASLHLLVVVAYLGYVLTQLHTVLRFVLLLLLLLLRVAVGLAALVVGQRETHARQLIVVPHVHDKYALDLLAQVYVLAAARHYDLSSLRRSSLNSL